MSNEIEPLDTASEVKMSSTGLPINLAAMLCYLFGFWGGIAFILLEKDSPFVKFHALQSIFAFVGLAVVGFLSPIVPFFGVLVSAACSLAAFLVWLVMLVKSFQGEEFKLPIVGALAADRV